ncbi:MAG: hypothetical protein ACI9XP_001298 [Lentimonas sp.]|jgi:uncharacterized protein (DUF2141 family)
MKSIITLVLVFLGHFVFAQNPTLKIEVTGFENDKGTARIGVYNKKEDFGKDGKQISGYVVKIVNKKAYIEVTDLPAGWYALAAYHDVNENDKIDKNFIGIPTEIYGFSRNARSTFSTPDYMDATFQLKDTVSQKFVLK